MRINLIKSLSTVMTAVLISVFPVTANAYTSTGIDGLFQPTASVVLNTTQFIYNFTDLYIPKDVTISFSGIANSQPIELLATGNIDIQGTLDVGANSLWIETPGSISGYGSLSGTGSLLSLVAGNITLSGPISNIGGIGLNAGGIESIQIGSSIGRSIQIGNGTGVRTGNCSGASLAGSVTITSHYAGSNQPADCLGSLVLSAVTGGTTTVSPFAGGTITLSPVQGQLINSGTITVSPLREAMLSPVPEPRIWAMLLPGLFTLFAVSRLRKPLSVQTL